MGRIKMRYVPTSALVKKSHVELGWCGLGLRGKSAVFSFLYYLKIKISKIYVYFEIFQKYPPVAPP